MDILNPEENLLPQSHACFYRFDIQPLRYMTYQQFEEDFVLLFIDSSLDVTENFGAQ